MMAVALNATANLNLTSMKKIIRFLRNDTVQEIASCIFFAAAFWIAAFIR